MPLSKADDDDPTHREPKQVNKESISKTRNSLQDPTLEEIRKKYWQNTLAEIRNMSFGFNNIRPEDRSYSGGSRSVLGQQWKWGVEENASVIGGLSNGTSTVSFDQESNISVPALDKRRRFEGFMSWDRMLQEWSDDIQEYMEQIERESNGSDYSFGNFGRSAKVTANPVNAESAMPNNTQKQEEKRTNKRCSVDAVPNESSKTKLANIEVPGTTKDDKRKPAVPLPIPAPARPGEAVLPHTDLSDLSKRVEIVTTASLPWRTGTAVNPLLRAAYLSHNRAAAGGSVTLMLPWLERQADQEKVYGKDQTFDSPEHQEAYIRDWLRTTAGMPEAANDLRIRWYTAWQNPAENSIYSMGDITALIPPDEVDICILEEPEHLNWYRAPGESWTKRFKHVVGILHTSKFCWGASL